jgi:tRNA/tmRNA/rRNA uracil-C5-methylase (TrmA/RlmC/RlmD family)
MEQTFKTKFGTFFVDTDGNKKMAQLFERNVHPQVDELEIFRRYVNSNSTFLDLGAYIGTISVPMAKTARAVHSFEPRAGPGNLNKTISGISA